MTMTITLSEDEMAFVSSEAAKLGYAAPADYLVALIEQERRRDEDEAALPLIREALASGPATPMTREDWDSIREEVRAQLGEGVR